MFISRKCLDAVGLLEESYFLYYEELIWLPGSAPNFTFDSLHRASFTTGASIGSAHVRANRSVLRTFYQARNHFVLAGRDTTAGSCHLF